MVDLLKIAPFNYWCQAIWWLCQLFASSRCFPAYFYKVFDFSPMRAPRLVSFACICMCAFVSSDAELGDATPKNVSCVCSSHTPSYTKAPKQQKWRSTSSRNKLSLFLHIRNFQYSHFIFLVTRTHTKILGFSFASDVVVGILWLFFALRILVSLWSVWLSPNFSS